MRRGCSVSWSCEESPNICTSRCSRNRMASCVASHALVQSGSCGSGCIRPWLPSPHSCVISWTFDSMHWTTAWRALESQGMPQQIVEMLKRLYDTFTVAVRLSTDDLISPTFRQVRGTRLFIEHIGLHPSVGQGNTSLHHSVPAAGT